MTAASVLIPAFRSLSADDLPIPGQSSILLPPFVLSLFMDEFDRRRISEKDFGFRKKKKTYFDVSFQNFIICSLLHLDFEASNLHFRDAILLNKVW